MSRTQDASSTQPPSSYELPVVQSWFSQEAKGVHVRRMEAFRNQARRLENLEIRLEVDASAYEVTPQDGFRRRLEELAGTDRFEPHFEVPAVTEYVARAMAKGGYRGFVRVAADGETVYERQEHGKDLANTLQLVTEASHRNTRCQQVQLDAIDDDIGDTRARLTVRKDTKYGKHLIDLTFDGEVPEDSFQRILAHLRGEFSNVFAAAK